LILQKKKKELIFHHFIPFFVNFKWVLGFSLVSCTLGFVASSVWPKEGWWLLSFSWGAALK
jgi:hypothetical protein